MPRQVLERPLPGNEPDPGQGVIVSRGGLDQMLQVLLRRGYRVVGPTLRDQAIVYDDISTTEDLPVGWTDEHEGGHYRLHRRADEALFGITDSERGRLRQSLQRLLGDKPRAARALARTLGVVKHDHDLSEKEQDDLYDRLLEGGALPTRACVLAAGALQQIVER